VILADIFLAGEGRR